MFRAAQQKLFVGQDLGTSISLNIFSRSSRPCFLHDVFEAEMGEKLFKHLPKSPSPFPQPGPRF